VPVSGFMPVTQICAKVICNRKKNCFDLEIMGRDSNGKSGIPLGLRSGGRLLFVCGLTLLLTLVTYQSKALTNELERAHGIYLQTRREFETNSMSDGVAWRFAQACFERAEMSTNNTERVAYGREGINAARKAVELNPKSASAHYFLGMNLGQVARVKRMSALRLVDEMEVEFLKASELDEKVDFAGPDRCIGVLYRDAPGWPISIGSRSKAVKCLEHAVEVCPEYPENHLCLLETYLDWSEESKMSQLLEKTRKLWPEAKKKLVGDKWQSSWEAWDKRLDAIESKMQKKSLEKQ